MAEEMPPMDASLLAEQTMLLWHQARILLEQGKRLAEQLACEASRRGDIAGMLAAHVMVAGFFQAPLGHHKEGEGACAGLAAGAEALLGTTQDPDEKMQILRVILDAQLHHIGLLISRGGSAIDISILLQKVEANAFYCAHKDELEWSARAEKARTYLEERRHHPVA